VARSRGSEQRRKNRSSDWTPPHLRALLHWDQIEGRLRCRWTPHEVVAWHGDQHPGSPQPTVRALKGFLRQKPTSWFVVELAIGSFTPSHVSQIFVARELAPLIEVQKFRLNKFLAREQDSGGHMPQVQQAMEFLLKLYAVAAREAAGGESAKHPKSEAAEEGFRHPVYSFLPPDDARRLVQIEQQVDRGEIDLVELYRLAAPLFEAEQRLHRERGPR
jgi:hypothetical protein